MKIRSFILGVGVGVLLSSAGAVYAADHPSVTAYVQQVVFRFNGAAKQLDPGESALMYQNILYVPARFVAEQLGVTVGWDDATQTVRFDSDADTASSDGIAASPETDWTDYAGDYRTEDDPSRLNLSFVSDREAVMELSGSDGDPADGTKVNLLFNSHGQSATSMTRDGESDLMQLRLVDGQVLVTWVESASGKIVQQTYTREAPAPSAAESPDEAGPEDKTGGGS